MDHVAEDSPGEEACFDLRETLSFLQIGHLIQSGHSIKEIAKELKRSPKTVCDLIARVGRTDSAFPLVQRGLGTGARFELTSAGKTMLDLVIAAIPLRRARQVLQIFASHALVSNRVITACIADFLAKHSEMDVTIKFPTSIPFEDTVKEIGNTKLQSQSIGFFWGGETRAAISRNHGCRALRIGPQFDIVIVSHDRSLIREVNDVLANPDVDVLDQRSNGWIAAIGSKLQQKRPVQLNWLDPIPRLTEAAKPVIPPVKTETIDALLALVSADPTCYGIIPAIYECLDREGSNDIPYSLPVGKTDLIVVTPKDSAQDAVTEELVEPIREQLLLASIRPLRPGDITKHFPETLSKIKRYQYA